MRNKRKLAPVSTETPDGIRGSRGRNVFDPELTQDYISQVSEEIEGMITKKLSKEFNKTESRILGALSKLDEFLLNPQVRRCSVFQGASRNANSEYREIHGDRSSNDPHSEWGYFPHHSGQLNSSAADMVTETYPHIWVSNVNEFQTLHLNIYLPLIFYPGFNRNYGVIVYVHKSVKYMVECTKANLCHQIIKATNKNNQSFVVVCMYISTSFQHSFLLMELELFLNDISIC